MLVSSSKIKEPQKIPSVQVYVNVAVNIQYWVNLDSDQDISYVSSYFRTLFESVSVSINSIGEEKLAEPEFVRPLGRGIGTKNKAHRIIAAGVGVSNNHWGRHYAAWQKVSKLAPKVSL